MTATSLPQVQKAIYAALAAASMTVYDAVPETPQYPYTTVGDAVEVPDRTMGENGHEVVVTLSTFTRDGTPNKAGVGSMGFAQGLALVNAQALVIVGTVSQGAGLSSVDNHTLVLAEVESIETYRETDGITRRIDARYRLRLEDA